MRLANVCPRFRLLGLTTICLFVLVNYSNACVFGNCPGMPYWGGKRGSSNVPLSPNSMKYEQAFPIVLQDEIQQCLPELSDKALESGVCCRFGYDGDLKCRTRLSPTKTSFLCPAIKDKLASHLRVFMQHRSFDLALEQCCLGVNYCSRNFVCTSKLMCATPSNDKGQYEGLKPKRMETFHLYNNPPSYREY